MVLTVWLKRKRMGQAEFIRWLEDREVTISRATCSLLVNGKITPGPMFKKVFQEITGIELLDGVVVK